MVLENLSASQGGADTFSESAPADDDDPYNSSSPSSASYSIDRSNFPKPIPILGTLFGFNDQVFSKVLQAKIQNAGTVLKRPLSSDEATSMAYWTAKQLSILSYGAPIGIAGGAWRAYNTAEKFRFPFYQPNLEKLNPRVWPNERLAVFRGNRAVMAWHAMRLVSFGGVGNVLGALFFGSYSMSVTTVGEMTDPRLKDFVQAVKNQAQQKRGGLPGPGIGRERGRQQSGEQKDGSVRVSGSNQQDDASPTGGMFFDEVTEAGKVTGGVNGGVGEDIEAETRAPRRRGRWPPSNPIPRQRTQENESKRFDAFDDNSPTSGQAVDTQAPQAPGSAWERIRSGQKPSTTRRQGTSWPNQGDEQPKENAWAKQRTGTQADSSSANDGFTSLNKEEERRYGRGDAQREFDARVEQERRGGDFTGSGDQKRW